MRHPQGASCHVENDSVICYGHARIVEEIEERRKILDIFNHSFQPDAEDIPLAAAAQCYAVEITITEMTGRQQREQKHTYFSYKFE